MDRSYSIAAFDNRRLAGQYGGELVIGEFQTPLCKDKQGSKDKQESEDEQRGQKIGVEESNKTEDEQKGKETKVEEANKLDKPSTSSDELDEPSESSGSNYLFVPTV